MRNFAIFATAFFVVLCKLKIHLEVLIWPVQINGPGELWDEGSTEKYKRILKTVLPNWVKVQAFSISKNEYQAFIIQYYFKKWYRLVKPKSKLKQEQKLNPNPKLQPMAMLWNIHSSATPLEKKESVLKNTLGTIKIPLDHL